MLDDHTVRNTSEQYSLCCEKMRSQEECSCASSNDESSSDEELLSCQIQCVHTINEDREKFGKFYHLMDQLRGEKN